MLEENLRGLPDELVADSRGLLVRLRLFPSLVQRGYTLLLRVIGGDAVPESLSFEGERCPVSRT